MQMLMGGAILYMTEIVLSDLEGQLLSIDILRWVNWIAQDKSGAWWGYSVELLRSYQGWHENEVGEYLQLAVTEPLNWANLLSKVKNGKII